MGSASDPGTRYDFSTATKLPEIMEDLKKYYDGDLNELHHKAKDEKDLEKLLKYLDNR